MNQEIRKAAPALMIFGLLILILLIGVHHPKVNESVKYARYVGDAAPATALPVLQGGGARFTTASWRGRPYMIHFFASWCADCRAEHEEIMTLAALHLPIIGVAFKDKADKVAAYLDRNGNPFAAVAMDNEGRAGTAWGLRGIPETFIIDASGVIRWHHRGILLDAVVRESLMPALESVLHE